MLDRARGSSRIVVCLGPLNLPSAEQVAERLVRLASISPGNRLGVFQLPDGWLYDPARLRDSVLAWRDAFPDSEGLSIEDKVALVRSATPPPTGLRIYIDGNDLITDFPHAVFDGVLMVHLWLYLAGAPEWRVPHEPVRLVLES